MRISSSKNNLRQKYTDAQLEEDALKYNEELLTLIVSNNLLTIS